MNEFNKAIETIHHLFEALTKIIRGREDTIRLLLTGLVADGHVLIEDLPGSGKTTLAKSLGRMIDTSTSCSTDENIQPFRRIQFTPDLLPSDVLGVTIFDAQSSTFHFQHGPIFAHVILADEINRTGPKVQSAFLECMAEKQVTIDSKTYPLDELFFVIGTQNPLEIAGTYPLPLVQLDRFLLKIPMNYVNSEIELQIIKDAELISKEANAVSPIVSRASILAARRQLENVQISEAVLFSVINLVQETRSSELLQCGASTRAAIMFKHALAAWAMVNGRDHVIAEDFKTLAPYVLKHRLRFLSSSGGIDNAFDQILLPHVEALVRKQAIMG